MRRRWLREKGGLGGERNMFLIEREGMVIMAGEEIKVVRIRFEDASFANGHKAIGFLAMHVWD
jgi:hypothetical protein